MPPVLDTEQKPATKRAMPSWWGDEHETRWSRVRDALRRDWEQTKADLTREKSGHAINQSAGDTLRQAVGIERIPPDMMPNFGNHGDRNWELAEPAVRYGYSVRARYSIHMKWNDALEASLRREWLEMPTLRSWQDARGDVRRGWDAASGRH